jgi:hypothetical protein
VPVVHAWGVGALRGSQRPSWGCGAEEHLRIYSLRFSCAFFPAHNLEPALPCSSSGSSSGLPGFGPRIAEGAGPPSPQLLPNRTWGSLPLSRPIRVAFIRLLGWFQPSSSAPDRETVAITRAAWVTAPLSQLLEPTRELHGGLPEAALRLLLLSLQAHHSVPVPPQSKVRVLSRTPPDPVTVAVTVTVTATVSVFRAKSVVKSVCLVPVLRK